MHNSVNNLIAIKKEIQLKKETQIIAVSKTFPIDNIQPLINYGHEHYGENKVQEAINKWTDIKIQNKNIKLHLIGKLQTNKVKFAIKIFDYIHSVDSEKLAAKIAAEQTKQERIIKIFIQINIGNEEQKSGIKKENALEFYKYCKDIDIEVIGTMCIPPNEGIAKNYFIEMNKINKDLNLSELSMGMSKDYLNAAQNNSTFIRIGSKIFGQRD
jgi:pyridoxal phosphate enzyme (YggS family)